MFKTSNKENSLQTLLLIIGLFVVGCYFNYCSPLERRFICIKNQQNMR